MLPAHVVVGFHHWGMVTAKFCYSLARAISYEGGRIKGCLDMPSPYTDEARNKIVETFLKMPETEFLLMVDCDIEFEKDAISKSIWVAQNTEADVLWGNYALGGFSNSLFSKDPESDFGVALAEAKANKVYEGLYAGGTGWCLMRRTHLLKMQEKFKDIDPWPWFGRDLIKGRSGELVRMGEDLTFGKRSWDMGAKQVGYTGLLLLHHKTQPLCPPFMSEMAKEFGAGMSSLQPATLKQE